ncbi:MAG: VCBS repeat-containing protein [Archangium sp.]
MRALLVTLIVCGCACLEDPRPRVPTDAGTGADADAGIDAGACGARASPDAGGAWPPAGLDIASVRTVDLDLDGIDELVVGVSAPDAGYYVLHGEATTLPTRWSGFLPLVGTQPSQLAIADFSGDGCPDLLAVGTGLDGAGMPALETEVFLGFTGTGNLQFDVPAPRRFEHFSQSGPTWGFHNGLAVGHFDPGPSLDVVRLRSYYAEVIRFDWNAFDSSFAFTELPGPGEPWGANSLWNVAGAATAVPSRDGGVDSILAMSQRGLARYRGTDLLMSESLASPEPLNFPPPQTFVDFDGDGFPEGVAVSSTDVCSTTVLRVEPRREASCVPRFLALNERDSLIAEELDTGGVDIVRALVTDADLYLHHNAVEQGDGGLGGSLRAGVSLSLPTPHRLAVMHARGFGPRIVVVGGDGTLACRRVSGGTLQPCP